MTRARCCWGSPDLVKRLEGVRVEVITAERDPTQLAQEIRAMRQRLAQARSAPPDRFDLKHSPGGMIDVEFVVQFLVLSQARAHPVLLDNVGNIALLQRAEESGLLAQGVGKTAADAYRQLRHRQHQARLNEESTQLPASELQPERDAIERLWQTVLGER